MTNPWGETEGQSDNTDIPWHSPAPAPWAQVPSGVSPPAAPSAPAPPAGVAQPYGPMGPFTQPYLPGPVLAPPAYGVQPDSPAAAISHIRWLASGGWPPEAITADLSLRGIPTLGGKLPFMGDTWRPYMVKRIIAGEAPSASAAMIAGLCSWLINPFMLVSVASIILFIQTRREIKLSEGTLKGGGKAAAGFVLGLVAGLIFAVVIVLSITLQPTTGRP